MTIAVGMKMVSKVPTQIMASSGYIPLIGKREREKSLKFGSLHSENQNKL
jgi:hypothetical protein